MSHTVEILSVGTELLLGNIVNTDAQMLSQGLSALGLNVYYHTVVGDNPQRVRRAVDIARQRADIIITNHPDRLAEQLRDLSGAEEGQTGENERTGK